MQGAREGKEELADCYFTLAHANSEEGEERDLTARKAEGKKREERRQKDGMAKMGEEKKVEEARRKTVNR
jgi:hypothetical protein